MQFTIMGDSWACGEWGRKDPDRLDSEHGNRHPGITEYLRADQHTVRVLAQGGHGNQQQVEQAKKQGVLGQIIWFITDPLRDLRNTTGTGEHDWFDRLPREIQTLDQYRQTRDQQLRSALNDMRGHGIWLIGAVCPLPDWVEKEFPEYRIITPDFTEWLLGHRGSEVFCRQWLYYDCEQDLVEHYDHEEQLREQHLERARDDESSLEHRLFWPDGEHPNREAHRLLYDQLIKPLIENPHRI
jgi:hypothetical protein